jgi:Flp pilus assembly protein protease CpaA
MWAIATFTLVAGVVDDLRSRKVHNALVLTLFAIVVGASLFIRGFDGSAVGAESLVLSLLLTLPLYVSGVIGGGDVKLFAVFAFALDPLSTLWTLAYSILWGGLFGITRALLSRRLHILVRNTYRVGRRQKVDVQDLHRIPYTFALLLGWFTQLTLMRLGGGF